MRDCVCPRCSANYSVPESYLGQEVKCPACGDFVHAKAWLSDDPSSGHSDGSYRSCSDTENEFSQGGSGKAGCMKIFGFLLMIVMLGLGGGWIGAASGCVDYRGKKPREVDWNNNVIGAWTYTTFFVEKQLKSPKSAEFPSWDESFVTPLGDARYRVAAYVDAENSFGASIRTRFTAIIVRSNEEQWMLESLAFGE